MGAGHSFTFGLRAATAEQAELFQDIAESHGGTRLTFASRPEDRNRLWKARHDAFWAAVATRPGSRGVSTDICVPISRLAECVMETRADMDGHDIPGTMLGHLGDGNFHAIPLVDPDNSAEVERLGAFLDRLAARTGRAAHAPASTASARGAAATWTRSSVPTSSAPCMQSKPRLTRSGS